MTKDANDIARESGPEGVRRALDRSPTLLNGSTAARSNVPSTSNLVIRRVSDIPATAIRWLWPNRIATGKLTMLAGEPGLGKSQLTCWITATVTTGGFWPDNADQALIGSTIILSAEDDAADTIRPRLEAARADIEKVHVISAVRSEDGKGRRGFNLQGDLQLLETAIKRIGDVRLVVIDPISSYLGHVDSHRNAELRAVLEPIGEMAARLGVAVLAVTHLNKSGGASANSRFIGSIAFVAAARAAFIVARDPDDRERRLFMPTKNNLGREGSGIGFRIGQVVTASGPLAPTIFWDAAPVTMSAEEVLVSGGRSTAPARDEAGDFLCAMLADGPVPAKTAASRTEAAGFSPRTVRRAKAHLGVTSERDGEVWVWTLPQGGHGRG